MKKLRITAGGVLVSLLMPIVLSTSVMAWGPERPTYTNAKPADHAVFNSITDNAAVGDERDFVRIEEKSSGRSYSNEIEVEAGKDYEVFIYYHNDASETYNTADYNRVGVAFETYLSSNFPTKLSAGERGTVAAQITSSTTNPASVWDEAYITAKEEMTLHYVRGSATINNSWGANGSVLSMNLFTEQGTPLGLDELNGMILGCDRFSGYVVYTIRTEAVEKPVDPTPETPEDPTPEVPDEPTPEAPKPVETPKELPTTGPAEIALAVVVVIALVAGIIYWRKTSKAVRKATHHAKGKKK